MYNDFLFELIFRNKLLQSNGNEFQNLFYKLMRKHNRDFIEIKPQGSFGDKKCDGYIKNKGIFYQVYAPEDASNPQTQKHAIAKLKEDFEGLYAHTLNGTYETIKEFHFVINTKGAQGIYPDLSDKLTELSNSYANIYFNYIDTNMVLDNFMELETKHKKQILQCFVPDLNFIDIKFPVIQDIVEYLSKNVSRNSFLENIVVPDFDEKIAFNGLNSRISNALEDANVYIDELDGFLTNYSTDNTKNLLCSIYKTLYKEAKSKYPNEPNKQFQHILDSSYDKSDSLSIQNESAYIYNIIIIMAKYFNSCDIFEEPKKTD